MPSHSLHKRLSPISKRPGDYLIAIPQTAWFFPGHIVQLFAFLPRHTAPRRSPARFWGFIKGGDPGLNGHFKKQFSKPNKNGAREIPARILEHSSLGHKSTDLHQGHVDRLHVISSQSAPCMQLGCLEAHSRKMWYFVFCHLLLLPE